MKNWIFVVTSFLLLSIQPTQAKEYSYPNQVHSHFDKIEVTIIDEYGYRLPLYDVDGKYQLKKSYMQAMQDQHYSIEVRNRTPRRVGFVIAVDGRNIISGKPSYLKSREKMYVLDGHQVSTFRGWRSAGNTISRFYFTNENNSYAAAFNDKSAMGVIAVAAYYERIPMQPPHNIANRGKNKKPDNSTSSAARRQAGTGWGSTEHSPSTRVKFIAQKKPFSKHLIKYEWHQQLCKMGIINCNGHKYSISRSNRLWDDNSGYAAPPPRRTRVRVGY